MSTSDRLLESHGDAVTRPSKPPAKLSPWRTISLHSGITYLLAVLGALVSGNYLGFAAFSDTLKGQFNYSQSNLDLVISLGNIGSFLGPLYGIVIDIFGTRMACLFAALTQFLGYFLMYITTRGFVTSLSSPGVQGMFWFIASLGSQCIHVTALTAAIYNSPHQYRGVVVGSLSAVFAFSPTLYGGVYKSIYGGSNLAGFLLFAAVSLATVSVICAVGFRHIPPHSELRKIARSKQHDGQFADTSKGQALEDQSALVRIWTTYKMIIWDPVTWMIWFPFCVGTGASLMHISNFGQLVKGLNDNMPDSNAVFVLITTQSISNATFSVAVTALSDAIRVKRGWISFVSMCTIMLGMLLAATIFEPGHDQFMRIYIVTAVISAGYGTLFAISPTIISEYYGVQNFGQCWGFVLLAPGVASYAFNGTLGSFYDKTAATHNNSMPIPTDSDGVPNIHDCVGVDCFRNAYFVAFALTAVGTLILLPAIRHTAFGRKDVDLSANSAQMPETYEDEQNQQKTRSKSSIIAMAKTSID